MDDEQDAQGGESSAGRRGPYAKTAGRRADLLRAALASFAEHGYERSSLRDIAARAGLTHHGLLHHFASKDELLVAALAERDALEVERTGEQYSQGTSPGQIAAGALSRKLHDPDAVRAWLALSVAATHPGHPAHEYFKRRNTEASDAFRERPNEETRGWSGMDHDTKAMLLLALSAGLQLQWLQNPDVDILSPYARFVDLLNGNLRDGSDAVPLEDDGRSSGD